MKKAMLCAVVQRSKEADSKVVVDAFLLFWSCATQQRKLRCSNAVKKSTATTLAFFFLLFRSTAQQSRRQ
jgi:hypothetical protein